MGDEKVQLILVGNKSDQDSKRAVSYAQGQELSQQLGCQFLETSAKDRVNVDQVFLDITRNLKKSVGTKIGTTGTSFFSVGPTKKVDEEDCGC